MSEQPCLLQIGPDGIACLSLNRPKTHNALDEASVNLLVNYLHELEENPSVRVIVLKSIGNVFCAGVDLKWIASHDLRISANSNSGVQKLAQLMRILHKHVKPTIAVVTGATYGGGIGLVACCDIAIASHDANFCFSEVRLGLIPAIISPYIIRAIGERIALRYFLTAEHFDAQEAHRIGLVHSVVTATEMDTYIKTITDALMAGGPNALSRTKALVHKVSALPLDDILIQNTAEWITEVNTSSEANEGISAFLQKRKATWAK